MLLTKEVEVKCNSINRKYYQPKGYNWVLNTYITVKTEDLSPNSVVLIDVQCDICGKIVKKKYQDYRIRKETQTYNIDCCNDCKYIKMNMKIQNDFTTGKLKKIDRGFWSIKENRLNEIDNWIKKYNTINNLRKTSEGRKLLNNISNHNETPMELALELGYTLTDISDKSPQNYYKDWNKFRPIIENLIIKLGRFPSLAEYMKETKLSAKYIEFHGGIYGVKRKLNYVDDGDLVDDSGYYNSSSYEYILAQWLLHNSNVKIERNVLISPSPEIDGNFNCDFVLTLENGNKLWIEIWGGYRKYNNSSNLFYDYNSTHELKKCLYTKYNINVISLYPEFFDNKKYDIIQEDLYGIFKDMIDIKAEKIEAKKIIPYSLLDEKELIDSVMFYSDNKDFLPLRSVLYKQNCRLTKEISKRYGTYGKFSEQIGIPMIIKTNNFWDKNKILYYFSMIHNKYGKLLSRPQILNNTNECSYCNDLSAVITVAHRFGGLRELQLEYYDINIKNLNVNDLSHLSDIVSKKGQRKVTPEQQELAKQILDKYNTQQQNSQQPA